MKKMKISISVLLFITLILPSLSFGQCIIFASGGVYNGKPGYQLNDPTGSIVGINKGDYRFTVEIKGDNILNNLQFFVDLKKVVPNIPFHAEKNYSMAVSGWTAPNIGGTEIIILRLFDSHNNLICSYTFKIIITCGTSFGGFMDAGDRILKGDVNNDGKDDLVLINTGYTGTAIRVVDLTTKKDISTMNHGSFGGFLDVNDKSFIADANGDHKDDLILFNTGGSGSALRVIDLTTMNDIKSMSYSTLGSGWTDSGDRALIANVTNDDNEELVLINTGYTGTAIRVINLTTMNDISTMNHGSFGGFLDAKDISLIADANGDHKDDLVLFNTGGSGSALRVIDLTTMNDIKSMSYSTLGGGWTDSGDRALIANVTNDDNEELVLINTGYTGTAIRVINLTTMNDISTMNHGSFGGFLDAKDISLIADANGDHKDDLVLCNTGGIGTAIRVIDLTIMNDIKSMSYSTLGGGWNDAGDRALIANASKDDKNELVLINAGYTGMAIRVIDLTTMNDYSAIRHCDD